MRFIRTKDGIIFEGPIDESGRYKVTNLGNWKEIIPAFEFLEIVKQADTIEELCDELVFVYPRNYYDNHCEVWHLYHKCSLKEEIKIAEDAFRENSEEAIYGAIWTDKGLIYVAKMNEEGELELL